MPVTKISRSLFCYLLDLASLFALTIAGIALLFAMRASHVAAAGNLFEIFHWNLQLAVAGFLLARSWQIGMVLWQDSRAQAHEAPAQITSDEPRVLVEPEQIGRAA